MPAEEKVGHAMEWASNLHILAWIRAKGGIFWWNKNRGGKSHGLVFSPFNESNLLPTGVWPNVKLRTVNIIRTGEDICNISVVDNIFTHPPPTSRRIGIGRDGWAGIGLPPHRSNKKVLRLKQREYNIRTGGLEKSSNRVIFPHAVSTLTSKAGQ